MKEKLLSYLLGKFTGSKSIYLVIDTDLKVGDLLYIRRYGPIMCTVSLVEDADYTFELSTSHILLQNTKVEAEYFKDHYDVWIKKE